MLPILAALALIPAVLLLPDARPDDPPAKPTVAPAAPTPPPAASTRPSPAELVEAAVKAMGGREAIASIESVTMKLTVRVNERDMGLRAWSKGAERLLIKQEVPQMGMEITMGRVGAVAWMETPFTGVKAVPAKQIEQFGQFVGAPLFVLGLERRLDGAEVTGQEVIDGRAFWRVRFPAPTVEGAAPDPSAEVFVLFDPDTKRPAGMQRRTGPRASALAKIAFRDWVPVGDVVLFSAMDVQMPNGAQEVMFDEISFDEIEDEIFAVPEGLDAGK